MDLDITFNYEDCVFNIRVAGFIVGNNKILLQKSEQNDYWSLVGGRVSLMEDTKTAFIREVEEELGVKLKESDVKLTKVIENFFDYKDNKVHEFLFIYKVDANEELLNIDNMTTLDKENSLNKWHDLNDLDNINLLPTVLKQLINSEELEHIINKEI